MGLMKSFRLTKHFYKLHVLRDIFVMTIGIILSCIAELAFGPSLSRADHSPCIFFTDDGFILQKIVLSGCPQLTTEILYISVLPTNMDAAFKRRIVRSYTRVDYRNFVLSNELEKAVKTLSFRNVHVVDLSKCPNVHFGAAISWLNLTFPELRTFRACYCLLFQFEDLLYLLLRCPWINEIDLTIDTSVIIPKYSIISSRSEVRGGINPNPTRYHVQDTSYDTPMNSVFSNISKLTLEGRNDITGRKKKLCVYYLLLYNYAYGCLQSCN